MKNEQRKSNNNAPEDLSHLTGFKVVKSISECGFYFRLEINNKVIDGITIDNLASNEVVGMGEILHCLSHVLNSGMPPERIIGALSLALKLATKYKVGQRPGYVSKGLQVARPPAYHYLYEQENGGERVKVLPEYMTKKLPRLTDGRKPLDR